VNGALSRESTLNELEQVVNSDDPQYLPARFLLGLGCLEEGRLEQAATVFTSLIEPIERHNETVRDTIAAQWIDLKPRHPRLVGKLPILRHWRDFWLRTAQYLYGGDFYRYANNWRLTKEAHKELQQDEAHQAVRELRQANFEHHVNLFEPSPRLVKEARTAFRLSNASESEAAHARQWLDTVLDERRRSNLEHGLSMLKIYVPGALIGRLSAEDIEKHAQTIDKLVAESVLFTDTLTKLAAEWRAEHWKTSRELIESILQDIQSPSTFQAGREIESARPPRGRLMRYLFPMIASIRSLQGRFRHPLYREARYLRAQCQVGTRDRGLLEQAEEEAKQLLEQVLDEPAEISGQAKRRSERRRKELRALTFCLRVEAAVHLELGEKADDNDYRALMAGAFLISADKHAVEVEQYTTWKSPDLVATAYRAWALLERYKANQRSDDWLKAGLPMPPGREQEFLRKSLDARQTAATWICLAESQRSTSPDEARRSLMQALKLSPAHPYAQQLLVALAGTK
jgi:hypothetical protein